LGFESCVLGGMGSSDAPKFSFANFDMSNILSMQGDNDLMGLWIHGSPTLNLGNRMIYQKVYKPLMIYHYAWKK